MEEVVFPLALRGCWRPTTLISGGRGYSLFGNNAATPPYFEALEKSSSVLWPRMWHLRNGYKRSSRPSTGPMSVTSLRGDHIENSPQIVSVTRTLIRQQRLPSRRSRGRRSLRLQMPSKSTAMPRRQTVSPMLWKKRMRRRMKTQTTPTNLRHQQIANPHIQATLADPRSRHRLPDGSLQS